MHMENWDEEMKKKNISTEQQLLQKGASMADQIVTELQQEHWDGAGGGGAAM